jgi:8-oxo-dGTP pyrophosphatase MutT (NUDIX family)
VLAFYGEDRLLLIRHSYGSRHWMPPGGGMHPSEYPLIAAGREFAEELGCPLHAPFLIDVVTEDLHGARNVVHIVAGTIGGTPAPDGREVVAIGFFTANQMPDEFPRALRGPMPEWIRAATAARHPDGTAGPANPPTPTG